ARRAPRGAGRAAAGAARGRRLEAALAGERARLPAAQPALLLPAPERGAAQAAPRGACRARFRAALLPAATTEDRRAALPRPGWRARACRADAARPLRPLARRPRGGSCPA